MPVCARGESEGIAFAFVSLWHFPSCLWSHLTCSSSPLPLSRFRAERHWARARNDQPARSDLLRVPVREAACRTEEPGKC